MNKVTERSKAFSLDGVDIAKTIRDTITIAIPVFGVEVQKGNDYLSAGVITIVFFFMQLSLRFLKSNGVEISK